MGIVPTEKPRVLVTCSPELHAALVRFAKAADLSLSTAVSGFLEPAVPMIEQLAGAMEDAKAKRLSVFAKVAGVAKGSADLQSAIMDDVSRIFSELSDSQETKPRRRRSGKRHAD